MEIVKRKWGWYWTILDHKKFKLKFLFFSKGGSISLQRHEYRSELWMVLRGNGSMRNGDKYTFMTCGDYALIDCSNWHQYKALSRTTILEAQFGLRCEEEDIERDETPQDGTPDSGHG